MVSVANATALPFPDRSIDIYISNGIAEHFGQGPSAAIVGASRGPQRFAEPPTVSSSQWS